MAAFVAPAPAVPRNQGLVSQRSGLSPLSAGRTSRISSARTFVAAPAAPLIVCAQKSKPDDEDSTSSIDWNAEWKSFVEAGAVSKVKEQQTAAGRAQDNPLSGVAKGLSRFGDEMSYRLRTARGPSQTALIILAGIFGVSLLFALYDQIAANPSPPGGYM